MLGPVYFVLYMVDLIALIETHGLSPHLYADDSEIYGSINPAEVDELSSPLSRNAPLMLPAG